MNRWAEKGDTDSPLLIDGDPSFVGLDMKSDRGNIAQGRVARSENKRIEPGGILTTRPGTTFPGDFNPAFADRIIGSFVYNNPNGEEVMLIAEYAQTYVWVLQFGKDSYKVDLAAGNTGTGIVNFAQAFDKVFMFRYPFLAGPTLVWDGNRANDFVVVTLSTDGLKLIPNKIVGIPFANRVLLYNPYSTNATDRDQFIMTDVLDYTSYDNILGVFRVNAGESNMIASLFPFSNSSVIVFMQRSVHLIEDFNIDPMLTKQRILSNRIGAVGYQGVLQLGLDAIFLSEQGGFYRLSQLVEGLGVTPVPISRAIDPIIKRINWGRAVLYHSGAAVGDYAYFGLPLDRKNGACDAVGVLNTVTNEWESIDTWTDPNFRINKLLVTTYDGEPRVFGLDYEARRIYLLYDGIEDSVGGGALPVRDLVETRGYSLGDPGGFKRFQRAVIGIRSYDPDAKVTAISDGAFEEKELATITKDRLNFYTFAHPPFDTATGDPTEPYREDYSVADDEGVAIEDFEDLPDGELPYIPPTALIFNGVKQQSLEPYEVLENGRWLSLRIENSNGQLDVLGVGVEGIASQEGIRTLV